MTPAELKAFRQEFDLTQVELARMLGVDVMTISRWERGERPWPDYLPMALNDLRRGYEWGLSNLNAELQDLREED